MLVLTTLRIRAACVYSPLCVFTDSLFIYAVIPEGFRGYVVPGLMPPQLTLPPVRPARQPTHPGPLTAPLLPSSTWQGF